MNFVQFSGEAGKLTYTPNGMALQQVSVSFTLSCISFVVVEGVEKVEVKSFKSAMYQRFFNA